MQLSAVQTSLEPQPHRVDQAEPRAVREPEHHQGRRQPIRERTRLGPTSEGRSPRTPTPESNKLPNIAHEADTGCSGDGRCYVSAPRPFTSGASRVRRHSISVLP
jgi:hypothetical protein